MYVVDTAKAGTVDLKNIIKLYDIIFLLPVTESILSIIISANRPSPSGRRCSSVIGSSHAPVQGVWMTQSSGAIPAGYDVPSAERKDSSAKCPGKSSKILRRILNGVMIYIFIFPLSVYA